MNKEKRYLERREELIKRGVHYTEAAEIAYKEVIKDDKIQRKNKG